MMKDEGVKGGASKKEEYYSKMKSKRKERK